MPQVWNLPTIGSGLPAVAGMIHNRQQDDRRMKLYEQEEARRSEEHGLRKEEYQSGKTKTAEREKTQQALMKARWAAQPGVTKQMVEAAIPDIAQGYENARGPGSWAQATDEDVRAFAKESEMRLAPALGEGPPAASSPGQLYRTTEGYLPADQAVGKMPYEDQPTPPGPLNEKRFLDWYRGLSPADRQIYDQAKRAGDTPPEPKGFQASDSNAIKGLVTSAYGGVYDPVSGNITGLSPDDARNVTRVAARASQEFAKGGISHAEAVEKALTGAAAQSGGSDKFQKGVTYKDKNDREAVYLGDGKWREK